MSLHVSMYRLATLVFSAVLFVQCGEDSSQELLGYEPSNESQQDFSLVGIEVKPIVTDVIDYPIRSASVNQILSYYNLTRKFNDGIHVRHNGVQVRRNSIVNNQFNSAGHVDGVQVIPNDQFAGGMLENVVVAENKILSTANLQGIFASDGLFKNLQVSDNVINTTSPHYIAFNGVISGTFTNNKDRLGRKVLADLRPLRLGGGHNIWVLSTKETEYRYQKVSGDVNDLRWGVGSLRGTIVKNFPMNEFKKIFSSLVKGKTITNQIQADSVKASFTALVKKGLCKKVSALPTTSSSCVYIER